VVGPFIFFCNTILDVLHGQNCTVEHTFLFILHIHCAVESRGVVQVIHMLLRFLLHGAPAQRGHAGELQLIEIHEHRLPADAVFLGFDRNR